MAADPKTQAALALHRFGFGPRAGSLASVSADPRGAVLAELDRPSAGRIADSDLLTTGESARAAFDFRQEKKATRLALRSEREASRAEGNKAKANASNGEMKPEGNAPPTDAMRTSPPTKPNPGPGIPQQIYLEEAKARLDSALGAEIGKTSDVTL